MASVIVNNTLFTGKFLIHKPTLPSTNQFAHDLLSKTKPIDGTVILTDFQSAGKGQGINTWNAEPGKNITCSVIYDTSFLEARQPYFLNMAVANGLFDLLASYLDKDHVRIKWPNDILYKGKKLAGILIENTIKGSYLRYSVIGIGLNVNQQLFPNLPHASSLQLESRRAFNLPDVLENLCVCLERQFLHLRNGGLESVRTDYNERLYGKGEKTSWMKAGQQIDGVIKEVNASGQLLIKVGEREEVYNHGEIAWMPNG